MNFYKALGASLLAVLSLNSKAAQFVEASEFSAQTVNISNKEMTQISIEGGYISNIDVLQGEAEIKANNKTGQVIFIPLVSKPINALVQSENGKTYLLILKPQKMNADSIVIREGTALRQQNQAEALKIAQQNKLLQRNSEAYVTAIKRFVSGLVTNQFDGDISCGIVSGEEIPLWKETVLINIGSCSSTNLSARVFTLTNTSSKKIVVEEQEFYKKGVVAVGLSQHEIEPGEKSDIYVVFGNDGSNE